LASILLVSEKAIINARKQLVNAGLVSYTSGKSRRIPSTYSLSIDLKTGQPLAERRENEQAQDSTKEATSTDLSTYRQAKESFEEFRQKYPGVKRGLETEFQHFRNRHPNYLTLLPLLLPALERWEKWRSQQAAAGKFVPPYLHLKTWINQKRWEDEFKQSNTNDHEKQPTIID